MLHFVTHEFAEDVPAAWLDFNQDEAPLPIEEDVAESQIFLPYLYFDWDPESRSRRSGRPWMGLMARSYLATKRSPLPDLEGLILLQATSQPLSFYEVVRSDPGEGMLLRDVLMGGETEVIERTASRMMRPGDIGYGQLCKLPEVTTLGRWAPLCIPPGRKTAIIRLRGGLRKKIAKQNRELTAADLIRYREEIRAEYLDIRDAMRTPPRLTNTDGDPLVLHTLTFHTGSAHAAFEALAPLAKGASKKDLLEGAKLDDDGTLLSVEIQWLKKGNRMHRDWDNTILGHITISGQSLVVEVNSEKRAERIRVEIERRLGILVTHRKTVTQPPEAMLGKAERKRSKGASEELSAEPELDQQMREEVQRQFENWIFQKVPALGGRTPLEAVADPDGKEMVEALLLEWERQSEKIAGPGLFHPDINAIRRLLQLEPSAP
jgi:hypothetical protein